MVTAYLIPLAIVIVGLIIYHMFIAGKFGLSSYEEAYEANA